MLRSIVSVFDILSLSFPLLRHLQDIHIYSSIKTSSSPHPHFKVKQLKLKQTLHPSSQCLPPAPTPKTPRPQASTPAAPTPAPQSSTICSNPNPPNPSPPLHPPQAPTPPQGHSSSSGFWGSAKLTDISSVGLV